MLDKENQCKRFSAMVRLSAVLLTTSVFAVQSVAAQDSLIQMGILNGASSGAPTGKPVQSDRVRRITLEQIKQSVDPAKAALARLGQLSIEAARDNRLGVQADYYPKFSATFVNMHFSEFLGNVLSVRRPLLGSVTQVAIPLISQNQTVAVLTLTQPITPLLQVHQAVRIARADERIARAKAGVSVTKNTRDREVEEAYFKLLIAQCKLTSAQFRQRGTGSRKLYSGSSGRLIRASDGATELTETNTELATAAADVRKLSTSLNRMMGWPDDTELALVPPEPLVEDISLEEVSTKPIGGNPDVIEAEQTVIKARAAAALSKLEYIPTVAAMGGYLFQNALPSVPSNFGYGGVVASYNLFDFGKRERAVKEARAKVEMAEIALQLTKEKVAAEVKKSYFELERSRQLSKVAQKMGSSVVMLVNASSNPDSPEVKAARTELEVEMLEADFIHRQAFADLRALLGAAVSQRR
jgi:hypothetical protein